MMKKKNLSDVNLDSIFDEIESFKDENVDNLEQFINNNKNINIYSNNSVIVEKILSELLVQNKSYFEIYDISDLIDKFDVSLSNNVNMIYNEISSIVKKSNVFATDLDGNFLLTLSVDEIKNYFNDEEESDKYCKMKYFKQFYITHNKVKYTVVNQLRNVKKSTSFTPSSDVQKPLFECWGYADGGVNYVWSNVKNTLYQLTSKDLNENTFLEMFGSKILSFYAKYDREGNQRLDTKILISDIIDGCINAGMFNPNKMYGFGIFGFKDGVIVNSDELWSNVEDIKDRKLSDGRFFIKKERVNVSKEDTATQEDFALIKEYFRTWNYKTEKDFYFNVGHTFSSCFAGVNSFNSVLYIVAEKGSGKSKMMNDKMLFSAGLAKKFDAKISTATGIQQDLNINCCSVLIDEAESMHTTTKAMIEFARSAVDGKSDNMSIKGTTSGKARILRARAAFTFASIKRNALEEADLSRSQEIELFAIKDKKKHFLYDEDAIKENLGSKVISYIIANWKQYRNVCKKVYDYMFDNVCNVERFIDVQHQPYATYIFLNREVLEMTDEQLRIHVNEFMSNLDFTNEILIQDNNVSEQDTCLKIILSSLLRDEISNTSKSVIELINQYILTKNRDEATVIRNILGRVGIKAEDKGDYINVYLATKEVSFNNLLKSTVYATTDLTSLLKRHSDATLISDSVMIGGMRTKRSSVVLMSLLKTDYSFDEEDVQLMKDKKIGYFA